MTGPQNRGQLRFEHIFAVQTDAYCAVAEERILLFRQLEIIQMLVSPDIQGTNHYAVAAHLLSNQLVDFKLFFFCRERVAVHIQKLCTEQPYAFGSILQRHIQLLD
ncbi:hypothetical protein D3C75_1046850 [compost metagenome]